MQKNKISTPKGSLAIVTHYPEMESSKLAILCPGFLDSKDYLGLVGLAENLCEQGFAVVRFDPTGTWESGGTILDYTMTQYLEDIKNVLEYMLSRNKYENILIGGHSRGGQIAILYGARDPRISAVLGIMPSHRKIIGEERERWEKSGERFSERDLPANENEFVEFFTPFSYVLDYDKYDTLNDVARITVPIVLIAGDLDDVIEPRDVEEIFKNANSPKNFLIIPGIDHDYRHNRENVEFVNREILKQLKALGIV